MTAWADAYLAADEQCRRAFEALRAAKGMRCPELDSGGAQCTADAGRPHEHRYAAEDLPGYDAAEKTGGFDPDQY